MPVLLKLFEKIVEEGTLPNSLFGATITLIPKPDKDNTEKENYKPVSLTNIEEKNPEQNFSKQFSNTSKISYTMIKLGLFQGCKDFSIYANQSM